MAEVFAYIVPMALLVLLVLLYYIQRLSDDRQARGHQYPIQVKGV